MRTLSYNVLSNNTIMAFGHSIYLIDASDNITIDLSNLSDKNDGAYLILKRVDVNPQYTVILKGSFIDSRNCMKIKTLSSIHLVSYKNVWMLL